MSTNRELVIIKSMNQIPDFATEAEEREFWATHALATELYDQATDVELDDLPPIRATPTHICAISLQLDADLIEELRALGKMRGVGYQTVIKQLLTQGLAELRHRSVSSSGGETLPKRSPKRHESVQTRASKAPNT